ncbi:DUF3500 domain-containing protein [Rathayibacter sp. VKM Ac-2835]|nr:DUF3500 domain-containing protein [Rathayibacter sp. VKM Ac-2835]
MTAEVTEQEFDTAGVSAGGANTAEVVAATDAFLATLTAEQLETVTYDYSDNLARQTWSNFPATTVPREGIALADLSEEQLTAAMAVLEASLSDEGYEQVLQIQQSDDYLNSLGGQGADGFGSLVDYFIAVYGEPSETDAFMIQFGGHHLAQNLTYNGDSVSTTPEFVGTEPTSFEVDGTTVEPLAAESTALFSLFDGLDDTQLAAAEITSGTFDDLVMGPGADDGQFPASEGTLISDLSAEQQQQVTDVLSAYVGDIDEEAAAALLAKYQSEYDQTYIGWSGNTSPSGENTYFRIDGPSVWIEFINTRSQSTDSIHYHSVYRDKVNDYGSSAAS